MLIPVDTASSRPIYLQITDHIAALARRGQLGAGDRLPPSRVLAEHLHVHRSTVVNAYDELKARGILEARHGSGHYIAAGLFDPAQTRPLLPPTLPLAATAEQVLTDLWRINQVDGLISLALGIPADELVLVDAFEQARQRVLRREGGRALVYAEPQGYSLLRQAIAHDLARHGIRVDRDDILVTCGAQEALSLVARALSMPGDTALVEVPTFFGTLASLAHLGVQISGFGLTTSGPDWTMLTQQYACASTHPRFVAVTPDYHNPTGICWTLAERQQFVQWAEHHDLPVVEDATYRDLGFDGPPLPPLRALDDEVIYVGSFSKSLIPGLRIGFVVANGRLRDHLLTLKQITSGSGESLGQRTLAEFLRTGAYARHLHHVTSVYRQRRDTLLAALEASCPRGIHWTTPAGGFYTWLTLPPHIATAAVFQGCLEEGVVIAPATVFYPPQVATGVIAQTLRLCFARYADTVLDDAVRRVGAVLNRLDRAR